MQAPSAEQHQVIAVVDDDSSVRTALRRLCRMAGYDARAFASAQEFLSATATQTYDCLILDLRMPGMNGLELQRRLLDVCPALPVILITAHDEASSRARAMGLGAVAFLRKPFSNEEILAAILRGLRSRVAAEGPASEDGQR